MASTFIIIDAELVRADEKNDFQFITPMIETVEEVTHLWDSAIIGSFESQEEADKSRDLLIKNKRFFFLQNSRSQDAIFIKTGRNGELYTQFPEYNNDGRTYEILVTTRETRTNLTILKENGKSTVGIIGIPRNESGDGWEYEHAVRQLENIKKKLQQTNPGL